MPITIYVDKITEDGAIGIATNQQRLLKNAEKLKAIRKEDVNQSPIIFAAGRFVCSIVISNDQKEVGMIFMDFKKKRDFALDASKQFIEPHSQKLFMEVFEKVSKNYKENYNQVELVVDKNFVPDIVAK